MAGGPADAGLIRARFVPPVAVQEVRSLTRTRKRFVRERALQTVRRARWQLCCLSYYIQYSAGFLSSDNFRGHHENSIEFKLAGGRTVAAH